MNRARLRSLPKHGLAFDTETWLITPGNLAPPMVLGSIAWLEDGPRVKGALLDKETCLDTFAQALEDPDAVLITANGSFDLLVMAVMYAERGIDIMPSIFALFEQQRIYDTQIAEILHAIANGHMGFDPRTHAPLKHPDTGKPAGYSLAMQVSLTLGRNDAKVNDIYRLRYKEFDGVPLDQLPPEARDYPVDDSCNTAEVGLAQTGHLPKTCPEHEWDEGTIGPDGRRHAACIHCGSTRMTSSCVTRRMHDNVHEVSNQMYSAFCLHLGDAWGLRVDQARVDVIEAYATKRRAAGIMPFITAGIIREEGSEDRAKLKRLIALANGASVDLPCDVCAGTGKVPSTKQDELRCPECKGRCVPWKSGGTLKAPTVASCARCLNTGKVPHHKIKLTGCVGPSDEHTCDGTGLYLPTGVPRSDGGGVAFGRDPCFESGDELLMAFGAFKEDEKILKDYVPYLRTARICSGCQQIGNEDHPHVEGCTQPGWTDVTLTLKSNAVLETGRVSYRGYIQLFPRAPGFIAEDGSYIPSLRECFVARGPEFEIVDVPDDYIPQADETVVGGAL